MILHMHKDTEIGFNSDIALLVLLLLKHGKMLSNSNMMTETLSVKQVSMEIATVNWWMTSKRV